MEITKKKALSFIGNLATEAITQMKIAISFKNSCNIKEHFSPQKL